MKELSIEEKAKAYDKVVKRANELLYVSDKESLQCKIIESIFPELAESENEKIRKELIEFFKWNAQMLNNFDNKEVIAWLEKQGEQKPVDKVEPKFKVGDWVVIDGVTQQVTQIRPEGFYTGRAWNSKLTFKDVHLWAIQDAKDGDVLCTYECGKPKIVFILKGMPKKPYVLGYHCYYNIMYPHFKSDSEKGCLAPNEEDVKPATKEQCDLLFQKMKEAGYEWNAEKKTLLC